MAAAAASSSSSQDIPFVIKQGSTEYDLTFRCQFIPLHLVNGIRRFTMNSIPIAGFRDEPPSVTKDRSITIIQNHTMLYNEMMVTRIALLPIVQKMVPQIFSLYDPILKERMFYWRNDQDEDSDEIPQVRFEISSDYAPDEYDITTDNENLRVGTSTGGRIDPKKFFAQDLTTGDPILLHTLKFPYPSIDVPFSFNAVPVIGTGKENSSFTPVGPTSMRFIVDDERVQPIMEKWMSDRARERASKGLPQLSDKEMEVMRENFKILERQRIYKQDKDGPTQIQLRVESIGQMPSSQIVGEALRMMALQTGDLYYAVDERDIHKEQDKVIIDLGKIDHAIAQGITESWRVISSTVDGYGDYVMPSYEQTHPLKETMRLHLRITDVTKPVDKEQVLMILRSAIAVTVDDLSYLIDEWVNASSLNQFHVSLTDMSTYWDWIDEIPHLPVSSIPHRRISRRTSWKISGALKPRES